MADAPGGIIYEDGDKIIRYATEADYDRVVAINDNIYEGMDYIPTQYFYYLCRPGTHCFVNETKGQVVAFIMMSIIDEEKTILAHAARGKPDMGQHQHGLLLGGISGVYMVVCNPQVTSFVSTSRHELDNPHKRESILRMHSIPFELNTLMLRTKELHSLNVDTDTNNIYRIEGKSMKSWLLTHGKRFFPVYIQMDYYPFKFLPGNIDIIVDERKAVCYVSKNDDTKDFSEVFTGVSFHVTHGTLRSGLMCIFHYYGNDLHDFEEHLKHHLDYLKTNKKLKVGEELHVHCNFQQVFKHKEVSEMALNYRLTDGVMRPGSMLIQVVKDMQNVKQAARMLSKL